MAVARSARTNEVARRTHITAYSSDANAERHGMCGPYDGVELEARLSRVLSTRDAQARELQDTRQKLATSLAPRPCHDIGSQTVAHEGHYRGDPRPWWSQGELGQEWSDLDRGGRQAIRLRERPRVSTSKANETGGDRNRELGLLQQQVPGCVVHQAEVGPSCVDFFFL